jgi:hypothetical protein
LRTNGRSIPQQLSKIEQRQRRIRLIRENLNGSPTPIQPEEITVHTDARFNIATSRKNPVHIPTFLQKNLGDPAVKVSGYSLTACTLSYLSTEFLSEVESPPPSSYPGGT